MEKKVEVKTYVVYKICPKCKAGRMFYREGMDVILTYPVYYTHRCEKCGYESMYFDRYPKIEYEPVKNS